MASAFVEEVYGRARAHTRARLRLRAARAIAIVAAGYAAFVLVADSGAFVTAVAVAAACTIVQLPIDGLGFRIERTYGLVRQPFGGFCLDVLKRRAIAFALLAAFLLALALPGSDVPFGWAWCWVALSALWTAFVVGLPALVRLFARARPLDPALAEDLESLGARAGVPRARVEVLEVGAKTAVANAAVIGFGPTRRIVITDTLIELCDPDEVRVLVAHELGHARLRHVPVRVAAFAALEFVACVAVSRVMPVVPHAATAGTLVTVPFVLAAMLPLNTLARRQERAADRFAWDLTGGAAAFIRAVAKVEGRNLVTVEKRNVRRFVHPVTAERVAAAERWLVSQKHRMAPSC